MTSNAWLKLRSKLCSSPIRFSKSHSQRGRNGSISLSGGERNIPATFLKAAKAEIIYFKKLQEPEPPAARAFG